MIERLPVELIFLIIDYLDAQEIVALQSTCSRLRGIIVSQLWGQLQLKCTGPKWRSLTTNNNGKTNVTCGDNAAKSSFYHKHANKRGGYVACDVATNLRQFAKAARLGAFDSVFQWVRALSLVTTLTLPTKLTSTQLEQLTEEQFDQLDIETVMAWLVGKVLPEKITELRMLEIMLEYGPERESNVPIVQQLISQFPNVETNVHIQLDHEWKNVPTMSFGNIKILHVQCEGLDDVQRLCGGGQSLPATIEHFELVDSKEMAASNLRFLLSGCKRLKSLSLKWGHVSNPDSIEWLPASVTDLQMCHFHGGEETYRPVSADGVVYFKSYSRVGSVFNAMQFPNLERLAVQGPVDDESHLTRAVAASFATSPHIKQLKCRRLRPSFVTTILESTRHSLSSLIVLPGGMSTHVPAADCLKLATRLRGIETLIINISSLSQHNVIRFLRDALRFAPSLKTIYIEHIFLKKEPWMRPLDSPYVYDGYSRVRVENRWTYMVDTALFADMHIIDPDSCTRGLPMLAPRQQIAVMN